MTQTIKLIDRRFKEDRDRESFREHLGASVIGRECARSLVYGFRWAAKPDFDGRMYRIFERGQREEDMFVYILRKAGIEVHPVNPNTGEQFRVSDLEGHFGGSMDGAARGFPEDPEWHVIEMKTHNDKSFKNLVSSGVASSKPEHHAQMQVYMYYTGMKKAAYIAVNKNDDQLHVEFIPHNEAMAVGLIEKARNIIYAESLPPKIGGPDWFVCKWCDVNQVCHHGAEPLKNCRTCEASVPGNGRWVCMLDKPHIDHDPQGEHPCYQRANMFF